MGKKQILAYSDKFPGGVLERSVSYEGVLLKPMDLPPFSDDPASCKARVAAHDQQIRERIDALFQHYFVSPGDWEELAVKLAARHVPGFRQKGVRDQQRGRPAFDKKELVAAVEKERSRSLTIKDACVGVAKSSEYKSMTASSIERRYYEARKPVGPKKLRK